MNQLGKDCFPQWLKNRSRDLFGPQIQDAIPYPVYIAQPPQVDASNPNVSSAEINDSYFNQYAGVVASAANAIGLTVYHVNPNNLYDTIDIVALDLGHTVTVPIFLSFIRPGRIVTETPTDSGLSNEVLVAACNPITATLAGFDISSIHNFSGFPQQTANGATINNWYSCLHYESLRTNKPFYVWFGYGTDTNPAHNFDTAPATGAAFKISWQTKGR